MPRVPRTAKAVATSTEAEELRPAPRNVADDGEGEAVFDGDAAFSQGPEDAGRIVGPGFGAGGEEVGDGLVDALVEVDGVGEEAAVSARGDGD